MVSVLMCTYNRESYLQRAIESVLNQTYQEIELVIVDDGSTDGTRQMMSTYQDERVKFLPLEYNSFYCNAANRGLELCAGDYVAFMNSDDEWLPEKIEKQVKFMEKNPEYGACFTSVYLMNNKGEDITDQCIGWKNLFATNYETQKEWLKHLFFKSNCLCHPSALVRKSVLEKVGGFNLMYRQLADYDLWIRIVEQTPIHVLQEPLIRFRWDTGDTTQVSSDTEGNRARTYNEQMIIRRNTIQRLTDEQMTVFFGDEFKNSTSKTHVEIEFEKGFMLAAHRNEASEWQILAIEQFERALNLPGAIQTLHDHFGSSVFDIYEWNKTFMYRDPWIIGECARLRQSLEEQQILMDQQQSVILEQQSMIEQQQGEIEAARSLIDVYQNSTSWKVTEPLRRITAWFRK